MTMNYIHMETGEYPVTRGEIAARRYPDSVPSQLEPEQAAEMGYAPVHETPQPALAENEIAEEAAPVFIGGEWVQQWAVVAVPPPLVVVPVEVTMRQARLALHAAGLLEAAQTVIDALPEPDCTAARIEWEYAASVRRDNPLIGVMIAQGLATGAAVDDLFFAAAQL